MSRESLLERVRRAARAGNAYRVHLTELPERVGYAGGGDDLCGRMAAEVDAVGGHAHLVDDLASAGEVIRRLVEDHDVKSALCWEHPLLDRLGLDALLASCGVEKLSHRALSDMNEAQRREKMLDAGLGISSTTWAIAETGTLAVASGTGRERLATLLPPLHVAVVERSQILPDLFDLFAALERKERKGVRNLFCGSGPVARQPDVKKVPDTFSLPLPSNLTLITGPSKTGDIELQLTTGVHGPGTWHVVVAR